MRTRRRLLTSLILLGLMPAMTYPQEPPLKIVFPFAAGGAADAVARTLAEHLQKRWGRTVVVENKTGAGGRIGAQAVKESPADGATLLFAAAAQFTLQPHVMANLGYDPLEDFAPIARILKFEQALAVSSQIPAGSVQELAEWMRTRPERAVFGSPGIGTGPHLAGLAVGRTFGIDVRHAPYRGTPAALPDLRSGRVTFYLASVAELIEHHKVGGIRIIATAGDARARVLPDVPTLRESGVKVSAPGWFGFYVKAGTATAVRQRLEREIAAAVNTPAIRARIESLGFEATEVSAEELRRTQLAEYDAWGAIVKSTGVKLD